MDVLVHGPGGREWRVPAFWAGDSVWRVRFAAPQAGSYTWRTECSDEANADLHGTSGSFEAGEYEGGNELLRRGPIRLSADGRHFQHADGTPFFLLGDDWWHGLTNRLRWPDEFRALTQDRIDKGFSVIKITAGLNCDVSEFDPRNHNEAGHCWQPRYASIRPEFFDLADLRIAYLLERGIVPCIVGAWGYYITGMGVEKMKKHWRYLVARWGAWPVIWQLTMESDMAYYLSSDRQNDVVWQREAWAEVGRYLREMDPYHRLITMQPSGTTGIARKGVTAPGFLDFDSMQCGHGDRSSAIRAVRMLRENRSLEPKMPMLPGEVCFEGIGWQNWQNIQRLVFWGSMLNGAAGFCYGANGIWQFNRRDEDFGASPHGRTWGGDPWDVAAQYTGSTHIGMNKKFLTRFPYWRMEPHPEWVRGPNHSPEDDEPPWAAGVPGEFRIAYMPNVWHSGRMVRDLEHGVRYRALWWDPVLGKEYPIGAAEANAKGEWAMPDNPGIYDCVLALQRT